MSVKHVSSWSYIDREKSAGRKAGKGKRTRRISIEKKEEMEREI